MNKACPVIIRAKNNKSEVLAFIHPLAGKQLIKGTITPSETLEEACTRELEEESGLVARAIKKLGVWSTHYENQVWGFCLMECETEPPESWEHYTSDDGGHLFRFFWQPLDGTLPSDWHFVFKGAIQFINQSLKTTSK